MRIQRTFGLGLLIYLATALAVPGGQATQTLSTNKASILTIAVQGQVAAAQPSRGYIVTDGGAYRIQVLKPDFDFWANPGLSFTDTRIEVDATKQGGPDDNDFGVICGYKDDENFYFFVISSDGYYGIGKFKDGQQVLVGMESMPPTDVVVQGNATNHIQAECKGSTLRLVVNGQQLAETTDSDFTSGDAGLLAGSFENPGTNILFDNFIVREP